MKVIQAAPKFEGQRCTCKHCTAILEIEQSDLKYKDGFGDQRDYTPSYLYVLCPECGWEVTFKSEEFPNHIVEAIRQKHLNASNAAYYNR
jgi:RNase P subunit RPR2